MKRTALAIMLISALLFSAVAGTLLINYGTANPMLLPLTVTVFSPENRTYAQNNIPVAFTYSAPSETDRWPKYYYYYLDGQDYVAFQASNFALTNLSDGSHTLRIMVTSWKQSELIHYLGISSEVNFTVDTTSPRISVLSPETKVYWTWNVSLNFTVDEPVSQVAHSLDGQANVTVVGNTTLNDLPYGAHNVTIYATDLAGNVGVSETIHFDVVRPTTPFPTAYSLGFVAVIVAILLGSAIYALKRKH